MRSLHLAIRACLGAALLLVPVAPLAAQGTKGTATPPAKPPARPATTPAKAAPAAPAPPTTGYLQGVAWDSVHAQPLADAMIELDGARRFAVADSMGRFLMDSVPVGEFKARVQHPMLDTLGISLVTPTLKFEAGAVTRVTLGVPGEEFLVAYYCPAARRALGPAALVGRVREPDSDVPAVGARVSVVYYDPDPPGLIAGVRVKKAPRVRETTVGEDGTYRICGLPAKLDGKLQAQRKDGGATAEVPVALDEGLLAMRSMSVAPLAVAAKAGDSTARTAPRPAARVIGRVLNKAGQPVVGARVGVMGASAATVTRSNGEFVLDSLPAGTQALVVRQLGYRPTETPVELSSRTPARVTVRLGDFVPELTPVEVVSRRDEGLQKVGFLDRKRNSAGGYFIDPDQLERRQAQYFTDYLRTVPGLRVESRNGQNSVVPTRSNTGGGCVTYYVDGAQWQSLEAGDLDTFVRPDEVAAVEVYSGAQVPAQFTQPGTSCAAVVVWTKTRVVSRGSKR